VLVGESEEIAYYGHGNDELHLLYNFPLMKPRRLTPAGIRANQAERLALLAQVSPDAWPCNTLGNHDSPRVKSRYGDGIHDDELARVHLALLLTLRGTPFLYYGEEIGMTNLTLRDIAQFRDLWGVRAYHAVLDDLKGTEAQAIERAAATTRDGFRTPFQWADAPNAGFSPGGVETWLPVNPNYAEGVNVADEQGDPHSLLSFYREMIRIRKQTPALIGGDFAVLHEDATDYLAFLRHVNASPTDGPEQTCLVVLNFSDRAHALSFDLKSRTLRRLYTTGNHTASDSLSHLEIEPFEVYIGELT
jgi:alpha-glucosidase